ncbi:MAG: hypothetical protein ONB46_06565 [candidate division KSB1 bacterium]|nr:hypothetical protein [candidate division KSB1 bacterium]MDZ7367235.1 hypothetical protein [candidate division KSB1 bacterium]MDZ7405283.1 hypothetical protein [candidate division KSB1 bacterium]
MVIGILIFLWGLTPSFKPGVKKAAYPEPVKVYAEEINQRILPPIEKNETTPRPSEPAPPVVSEAKPEVIMTKDTLEAAYLATIDSLKKLLPPKKFSWESTGHWEQTWWERKWVVEVLGINDRLKSAFQKVNAGDYASKKRLLEAYISLIALFPVEQRLAVLKAAIEFSKDEVSASVYNTSLLRAAVANFSTDKVDFIETLATFGRKNPRDGRPFIEYANTILPKFNPEIRRPLLATLVNSYYNYFNDISKQQEATNLFLEMLSHFEPENQVKALSEYYRLYRDKNHAREQQIQQIEYAYQSELSHAESVLAQKKAKKATYRALGWKVIGGSVIFIAFVAMFLVLLSIQRNVKMIREMAKSVGVVQSS